ncbi:putative membrane protein YqiK [Streptomyces griseostramineus]|uniref:Membrane protein YqiK n=1 Tax=Streptomyces griseomycini TaxID=66895 RepID=A0A7W7PUL7_9ACTN|nr:putative membrane protein YqiK [Streptomyces griseomycini]
MHKKADAFERYGDAAVLQTLVEALPQVAGKAAEPLAAVDELTATSTDGAGQLPRTVADNAAQGVEPLSSTTGVDPARLLQRLARRGTPAPLRAGRAGQRQGRRHRVTA